MNPKIAIIGNGNLAFHFAKRFHEINLPIYGLVVRNKEKAVSIVPYLHSEAIVKTQTDLSEEPYDFIIIAVTDSAITEILEKFKFPPDATIVHTSGSQSIDVFQDSEIENYGVIYPLQTFSKEKEIRFDEIKLFTESNNEKSAKKIHEVASLMSPIVSSLNSAQRLKLHLAAVFACNFSNVMYQLAEEQLNSIGLDLKELSPLIEETYKKALSIGAKAAQTGPASRGDAEVVSKHLNLLDDSPEIKALYDQLSKLIRNSNTNF